MYQLNELFDKLIIRITFTLFICFVLVIYKYAHSFLYPSSRQQLFKKFYPSKNSADSIHLFSRLIGIGIIFSEFHFYMSEGMIIAMLDFLIQSVLICIIYLGSLYIIESIVLYNFEYNDEILKRRNLAYASICFIHSIGIAYLLKTILAISDFSIILLFFLWLFSMVLTGFATKSYAYISKLSFNRLLVQKNTALTPSYLGFFWGWILIISSSFNHQLLDVRWYSLNVIIKIILSLIILPIFKKGILFIFKIQEHGSKKGSDDLIKQTEYEELGHGVYEGAIFFTSCFLTSVITGRIHFGTFYPIF